MLFVNWGANNKVLNLQKLKGVGTIRECFCFFIINMIDKKTTTKVRLYKKQSVSMCY